MKLDYLDLRFPNTSMLGFSAASPVHSIILHMIILMIVGQAYRSWSCWSGRNGHSSKTAKGDRL